MIDRDLVVAARDGDRNAFRQLMHAVMPVAYSVAYAVLRNRQDTEDAIQQAVLTALDKLRTLREPGAFRAWFLRIVANHARGIRRRQRSIPLDEAVQVVAADPPDIDRAIDMRDAIARLPDAHRAVVLLYYSGLSTRDVASTLGRPVGTIKRMLSEAYRMLRRDLRPDSEQRR